jgi:DNA polymerase IV
MLGAASEGEAGMKGRNTIMHIDLNSFYASCEIMANPDRYHPDTKLAVTGNPDARCGVILAASQAAKRYGVKAGMTMSDARNLCSDIVFVKARFPLYFRMSKAVMTIIRFFSPAVEQYGIDEAYLDYTGMERLFGPAEQTAHRIKDRIREDTGLTCSVGVAPNKLLAKMGSDYKKPDAVTVIHDGNFKELIWPLPAKDLIFVGRKTDKKLQDLGIMTVGDLAAAPLKMLQDRFGVVGALLWLNANGMDDSPVRNASEPVKGIGNSSTLPNDALTLDEIKVMLLAHTEQVAKRLRAIYKACRTVQIKMKDSKLNVYQHQATLEAPTDLTEVIYSTAARLAKELWKGERIRLVGVRVTQLSDIPQYEQLSLFSEENPYYRKKHLNTCVDDLRERFGSNAVFRGAILAEGLHRSRWYEDVFT